MFYKEREKEKALQALDLYLQNPLITEEVRKSIKKQYEACYDSISIKENNEDLLERTFVKSFDRNKVLQDYIKNKYSIQVMFEAKYNSVYFKHSKKVVLPQPVNECISSMYLPSHSIINPFITMFNCFMNFADSNLVFLDTKHKKVIGRYIHERNRERIYIPLEAFAHIKEERFKNLIKQEFSNKALSELNGQDLPYLIGQTIQRLIPNYTVITA